MSRVLCPKSFFIPGSTLEESEGVFAVTCAQAEVLNFKVEHLEKNKNHLSMRIFGFLDVLASLAPILKSGWVRFLRLRIIWPAEASRLYGLDGLIHGLDVC